MKKPLFLLTLYVVAANCPATTTSASGSSSEAPVTTVQKKWVCEAQNLVSGNYSGGGYANIHLSPYSYGGSYPVVKNGDTATGTTKDGTKFVCKEK